MMYEKQVAVSEDALKPKYSPLAFAASAGTVTNVCNLEFEVKVNGKVYLCAKAASCLLKPSLGDTVIVQGIADAGVWILAVLVRSDAEEGQIELPRIAVFANTNGAITFQTQRLEVTAHEAHYQANKMAVAFDDLQLVGRVLNATVGRLKAVGQVISSIADRITQHSQTYSRTTVGMDRVEAEQIEMTANQMMRSKAPYVLVEGDNLVKTKGSQIHFG
jgi:Protein of unknown function (DUF3540)